MRVQRCHSRPARPAHRALLETCALHRASLHCAASPCGSPNLLSLPAASGQREGSQSACAVLLVVPLLAHLSSTCCGPIHLLLAVLQASPRGGQPSATPQLPCSLTQRLRSSLQCPARSSRCCHPPPDPCHTLGQPLCARCGGDPRSVVTFGLLPLELPCSRSCSARSLCLCAAGRWQPLSATPTLWEWVRAGMS